MQKMNKKSQYYDVALAIIVFAILLTATIVTEQKKAKFVGRIGEQQFELIQSYQDMEKNLYYIDRFAAMVLSDAIAKITKEGGEKNADCGAYQNMNLWSAQGLDVKEAKTCYPELEKVKEAITKNVKARWPKEFPNAPILTKLLPKEETPNIIFNEKTTYIYKAKEPFTTPIGKPIEQSSIKFGEYSVLPRFKIETSFNINEFDEAKKLAEKVVDECAKEGGDSLIKCVYSTKVEGNEKSFRKADCKEIIPAKEESVISAVLSPIQDKLTGRTFPICYPSNTTTIAGAPNIVFALFIPDKRELDLTNLVSGGILGINPLLDILGKMDFNVKEIDIFKLTNIEDALPDTFVKIYEKINGIEQKQDLKILDGDYIIKSVSDYTRYDSITVNNGVSKANIDTTQIVNKNNIVSKT